MHLGKQQAQYEIILLEGEGGGGVLCRERTKGEDQGGGCSGNEGPMQGKSWAQDTNSQRNCPIWGPYPPQRSGENFKQLWYCFEDELNKAPYMV
jgi:hypothetical protein